MQREIHRVLVAVAAITLAACASDDAATADTTDTAAVAAQPTPPAVPPASATDTSTAPASGTAADTVALLDPETAPKDQLMWSGGIDNALADAIIAARPIRSMLAIDSLLTRRGLNEAARDNIYSRIWKPIDINTASAREIELIPGVGPRMRGEFVEYRPYRSIEQFRREIGKYVNEQEVARLERYIRIP